MDLGGATLEKLDDYIRLCDAVVHLVGDMTGADADPQSTAAILARYPDLPAKLPPLAAGAGVSYTQWEASLALYHDEALLIARADDAAPRGPAYAPTEASRAAQQAHLDRLRAFGRYPGHTFTSPDDLVAHIFGTTILDLLAKARAAAQPRRPRNLPYPSLRSLFKGREDFLKTLRAALADAQDGHAAAVTGKALHGLGGIGKTRLAVEYAWRHAGDYAALLFVPADTPQKLDAGLAALAAVLDLPEKEAREDEAKIRAALGWLDAHPGWLMILDNVDDAEAAAAVEALVARLSGSHVLVTGRSGDFSAAIETFPLDVLTEADAASLLLDSTRKRERAQGDESLARELARELDGLALALAQAGAYIDRQRIGFARYLTLWRDKRERVLSWFVSRLVSYNHDVGLAATWAASVEKLTPQGRELLEVCAFLDPAPIPKFLLDVPLSKNHPHAEEGSQSPSRSMEEGSETSSRSTEEGSQSPSQSAEDAFDAHEALADLFAYSLASPADAADGATPEPGFAVHRLVQDFTRGRMADERRREALQQALAWVNAAFAGEPDDVRTWPRLDPLAPHALAVARQSDEAGIAAPTGRLYNKLGLLFQAKARFAETEPLYRRAIAIAEASYGPNHPNVATYLNNLATLLDEINRPAGAELLFRRALAITEANYGPDHPTVAIRLNNLAGLLDATNRLAEAQPLYRRSPLPRGATGPIIPMWREVSTISLDCSTEPTGSPRPSHFIGARSPSTRGATAQIIPLWRKASTISPDSPRHQPPCRGRAVCSARARHRRVELRAGSSRCGECSQQSRRIALRHEPARRGRAALSTRSRHPRGELRAGSSRGRDGSQQSFHTAPRHEPPRRGRAAFSAGAHH